MSQSLKKKICVIISSWNWEFKGTQNMLDFYFLPSSVQALIQVVTIDDLLNNKKTPYNYFWCLIADTTLKDENETQNI